MAEVRRVEYVDSIEEAEKLEREFYDYWGYGYSPRVLVEKQKDDGSYKVVTSRWDTCD
jgi:hypothetical protein